MRDRILHYLSSGIKPAQVCTIVGCSPGYISQLVKEEAFQQELEELMLKKPENAEAEDLDNKYISLEHQILKHIDLSLVDAPLPALTRALEVVAKRQDMRFSRKHPSQTTPYGVINAQHVTVHLPAHALPPPVIELNANSEILAINKQNLAPMASEAVKNMFATMTQAKKQAEEVSIKALSDF